MNETYQEVFHMLSNALFSYSMAGLRVDNWEEVFREMKAQSVAALPYEWLKLQNDSQSETIARWKKLGLQSQTQWVKLMHGQSQLLSLLKEKNINCVILKGSAAAMAYPKPFLRQMGDVDFLVKRCDRDRTAQLLEENGYALTDEKDEKAHHYGYIKDGVRFELHWKVGIVQDSDEVLLSLFEEGIRNREIRETDGYAFPVLPTDLNGLVLISHINQHLRSGLGLRQIIDWMMYVHKIQDMSDDVWTKKLRPLLQKTGMEKLALCVTVMCQRYLGLPETLDGCETVDIKVCDELMEYIMEKGNFGRKSGETGKIASVYLDMSNPVRMVKRLQAGGMSNWSAARKHGYLRPVAWLFQIGHISKRLIKKHITLQDMAEQHTEGVKQRELIKKLGLEVKRSIDIDACDGKDI